MALQLTAKHLEILATAFQNLTSSVALGNYATTSLKAYSRIAAELTGPCNFEARQSIGLGTVQNLKTLWAASSGFTASSQNMIGQNSSASVSITTAWSKTS